jgi:hypothetical protein
MSISEFKVGGILRFGPDVHDFENTDQAATEAERDSYFSANPGKLAAYDGNSNLAIRLTYLDVEVVTKFQVRINSAWVDATPIVQGPSGDVASLAGVPVGEIPYKTITGEFAGSNIRILEDGTVLAPAGFSVESGSVTFGEALTLSEVSGFLGITNHLNDRLYTVVDFYTSPDAVSAEPSIFFLTAAQTEFVAQGTDTTNIPDNPLIYNYTVQNTARSHALKFRTYAPMTNVRIKISLVSNGVALKYLPSRQAWEEETGGVDWALGDNTFSFGDSPLNLNAGTLLKFELQADSVALKGNASLIPYFTAMIQPGVFIDVITDNVYTASDIKAKLEMLTSPNKLSKTAIEDVVNTVNGGVGDVVITKTTLGLGNVDNTSDVNKPVSTAQQTAINLSITNHNAAVDPHPQYTTTAEASAAAPVQSVNLLTGNVSLTTTNIPEGGSLYYNDGRVQSYLTATGYTVKSASSIGLGNAVYKQNSIGNLEFRSIIATGGIGAALNANDITLTVPTLSSGVYTPTLFNVANVAASSSFPARWNRVGNMITVSGRVSIDPASNNQDTILGMSLPIASNFLSLEDAAGTANCPDVAGQSAAILADIAADRTSLRFVAGSSAAHDFYYIYQYEVM